MTVFKFVVTPKSDQYLIYPSNITPEAHVKVTRIKEMITRQLKQLLPDFSTNSPLSAPTATQTVWRIYMLTIECNGFKDFETTPDTCVASFEVSRQKETKVLKNLKIRGP